LVGKYEGFHSEKPGLDGDNIEMDVKKHGDKDVDYIPLNED
jgi:hypothetical protein